MSLSNFIFASLIRLMKPWGRISCSYGSSAFVSRLNQSNLLSYTFSVDHKREKRKVCLVIEDNFNIDVNGRGKLNVVWMQSWYGCSWKKLFDIFYGLYVNLRIPPPLSVSPRVCNRQIFRVKFWSVLNFIKIYSSYFSIMNNQRCRITSS